MAGLIVTPTQPDNTRAVDAETTAAEAEATSGEQSSFKVDVVTRRAIAVVITVPGPTRCAATVEAISSAVERNRWQLGLDIRNTGNVHFRTTGTLTVRNPGDAQPFYESPFQIGYFIPGDAIDFTHRPDVSPPAGDYEVEAKLDTDCGFATSFIQPISLSPEEATTLASAQADNAGTIPGAAVDAEAARMQAQAEWIRSMAWLLGGIAVLVLVIGLIILAVIWVLRRRPPQVGTPYPPRQGGPITR